MGIQHCYEQSVASWNREWSNEDPDMDEMTEEEREEAEREARMEMEHAFDEAAWYREQERGNMNLSPCLSEIEFELDAAF